MIARDYYVRNQAAREYPSGIFYTPGASVTPHTQRSTEEEAAQCGNKCTHDGAHQLNSPKPRKGEVGHHNFPSNPHNPTGYRCAHMQGAGMVSFFDIYAADREVIDTLDTMRDHLPEEIATMLQAYRSKEHQLAEQLSEWWKS